MLKVFRTIINKNRYRIMMKLYTKNKRTRRLFYKLIDKYEGGAFSSETLRKVFRELHQIDVGMASYGCFESNINYGNPINIGNYCSFANNVHFIPGNHPPFLVSTHPYFFQSGFGYINNSREEQKHEPTIIGHDVWIGRGVIILPKCKRIGNGAIIGAGSVVTHNVEPYSIVAGNPARTIRKRFSDEEIELLEKSEWYELTPNQLSSAFHYAQDIRRFVDEVAVIKKRV